MSPKKTILRAVSRSFEEDGQDSLIRPSTISGFDKEPEKYQKAVNELLKARLIEGRKDADGHMAITLNGHRMPDVKRALRPAWAHPAIWAVALFAAVAAGFVI